MATLDGRPGISGPATAPAGAGPPRPWHRRPVIAGVALLAVYVVLSFANDPRGTLGTDTGIKIGTYRTMEAEGTLRPVIGYWAAPWDPAATVHPFRDTQLVGDRYVDVTTLPMVVAAYPLWRVGGYRLALLWPMAAAVAAAFVARGIARRLNAPADGWWAFWLAGLASPLVIYALDLWEHTAGVAAMAGGALVLSDQVDRPARWRGLAAGALFGLAFSMRTEALVYGFTTFAVIGAVLAVGRRWADAAVAAVGGVIGFVALALANAELEVAVLGQTIRSGRASGTAVSAGGGLRLRLKEALVTSTSPFPSFEGRDLALGALGALALVGVAVWGGAAEHRDRARLAAAAVVLVFVVRLASGPGFWPGLLVTTPIAAVGLGRAWPDGPRRRMLLLALIPLPLVFFFQYTGGALPQWGGRYVLTTGLVAGAVGAACLGDLQRWARRFLVGAAVLATAAGLVWLNVRTHQIGDTVDRLAARSEAVLVFPDPFVSREMAAIYGDRPWLASPAPGQLDGVADVLRRSGQPSFALLSLDPDAPTPAIPGFRVSGRETVPFLDPLTLTVTSYERA
jgi:hypothetical protein